MLIRKDQLNQGVLNAIRARRGKSKRRLKVPSKWLHPRLLEATYKKDLVRVVKPLFDQIRDNIMPMLSSFISEHAVNVKTDAWPDQIERLIDSLRITINKNADIAMTHAFDIGQNVSMFNREQWRKVTKSVIGVELLQSEPWLDSHLRSFAFNNAALIKNAQEQTVTRVSDVVRTGVLSGRRHTEIAKDLYGEIDKTKKHVRFIARDQVSKLNGELSGLRQQSVGIEEYTWKTALDERVRDNHRSKEGKRFKWSEPPTDTGHPGYDYQCRCYAEPVFDAVAEELGIGTAPVKKPEMVETELKLPKEEQISFVSPPSMNPAVRSLSVAKTVDDLASASPKTNIGRYAAQTRELPHEVVLGADSSASAVFRFTDFKPDKCTFYQRAALRQGVVVHNHPNNTCFSDADINMFRTYGNAAFVIVSKDWTYVLRPTGEAAKKARAIRTYFRSEFSKFKLTKKQWQTYESTGVLPSKLRLTVNPKMSVKWDQTNISMNRCVAVSSLVQFEDKYPYVTSNLRHKTLLNLSKEKKSDFFYARYDRKGVRVDAVDKKKIKPGKSYIKYTDDNVPIIIEPGA